MSAYVSEALTPRQVSERMYKSAMAGDHLGFLDYMSEDVVLYEPGFLPYGGVYRGRDGVGRAMQEAAAFLDVSLLKVEYIVADEDRAIGVLHIPELVSGQDVVLAEESLVRDGLIREIRLYFHEPRGLIAEHGDDAG